MVLIGLFTLLFLVTAVPPAHAIPVAVIAAILPASLAALAPAIAAVINVALSLALSFVASALFKKSPASTGGAQQPDTPIRSNFNVRVAAGPRTVVYGRRRVAGTYGLLRRSGRNQFLHMIILLAGHECEGFDQVIIGDEVFNVADLDSNGFIVGGPMGGLVRFKFHLGSPSQLADQDLIDELADANRWNPDCRLRGICYMYVRLEFGPHGPNAGDQTPMFADGIPNISAVLRGKKDIYDPRTATTGYSTNPALCVANYLCDTTYGLGIDYATRIDETALIASANDCDFAVDVPGGGTEARFACNGAFESSEQPQTVLGWLLGSMHGKAPYDGEKWTILAGTYQTPTLSFTDDDLRGEMTVETVLSRRDLFNTVKGTFTSPDHNWQEFDFPPVPNGANAYATVDGKTIYKDISLPFTTSVSMAQRLAKIDLQKARKQITVIARCKLTVWLAKAGDTIQWTSAELGWSSKPFDVRKATFVSEEGEGGPIYGVDLELAETAPSVYSMDVSEQQLLADMQPTDLPNASEADPPTNLVAAETVYTPIEGGGLRSRIDLAWSASPDSFALNYEVGYKLRAASSFTVLPRTSGLTYQIEGLAPGVYDLEVAAVNFVGVMSLPLTGSLTVSGIGAPPENVSGLTLLPTGGLALLRWTPPDDEALRSSAGGIEFRHAPVTSGATWATATPIGEIADARLGFAIVPLKAGTYLALYFQRLTNGVRQYSPIPATAYTAQVALTSFSTLDTQTEDPTFGGTHTQTEVSSSKLRIVNAKNVGTYNWTNYIDNGSVKKCRITVSAAAAVTSRSDLVDSWEDVDSRPSWDTVVGGHEATVLTYVSTTNDDPAGSPTWGSYHRIDSAEFSCRAARFRTDLWSLDPTWNIEVSALSAVSEEIA